MILNPSFDLKKVSTHYDQLSELYRIIWGNHLHHGFWKTGKEDRFLACEQLTNLVFEPFGSLADKKLLDIGCGYGESSRKAASLGAEVTGITLSEEQFKFASAKGKAKYFLGDWLKNPFENESLDGAYSIECFSHIEDKEKFFEQVRLKLKPNGIFSMTAWMSSPSPSERQKKWLLEPICSEGRLPSMWSQTEIEEGLSRAGLTLVKSSDISDYVRRTWSESIKSFFLHLKDKEVLSYLGNSRSSERIFAVTAMRIYMAFKLGSMRYGVFVAKK